MRAASVIGVAQGSQIIGSFQVPGVWLKRKFGASNSRR